MYLFFCLVCKMTSISYESYYDSDYGLMIVASFSLTISGHTTISNTNIINITTISTILEISLFHFLCVQIK